MGDKFRKVQPGDPLKIPAEAWNALLDVSQQQKNRQHDQFAQSDGVYRQPTLAKVRNQTGAPLDRFSIVALGNPIIGPSDNAIEFKRQLTFGGVVPFAGIGTRFGILLEPLAVGLIGTAVIAGCIIARVAVGATLYACATSIPGQTGYLQNVPHGPAHVLWMEPAGNPRWAVIRFDASNFEEIVFITSNIPDANGYYPGVVQTFDPVTRSWNSTFPCKVVDANQ
jgi:hypothetical protein